MLDELEELELVLAHYAITYGVKLPVNHAKELRNTEWSHWALQPSPPVDTDEE
jgi:[phosphatase 2A protein]-leucine-carboxy methyltransferase